MEVSKCMGNLIKRQMTVVPVAEASWHHVAFVAPSSKTVKAVDALKTESPAAVNAEEGIIASIDPCRMGDLVKVTGQWEIMIKMKGERTVQRSKSKTLADEGTAS